ncbi:hypothetical protein EH31_03420 [Erythrobacter longus]|uniref:Transmembrane protein n=1 Tax=Erythrobacter longus TaxID=1044 RepID=A0A074ME31_ERYLO|nr:DUF924 family protein [Erythrobacter longus]KEO91734.1 hypothetical protein EH31_03420 [Erythrobacter longus]
MNAAQDSDWVEDVLHFWFEELEARDWFSKNAAVDAEIEKRFGALHEYHSDKDAADFLGSFKEALAAIILFDQFSRNLFRGNPLSFASDPLGLALARAMVAKGWDDDLAPEQRIFAYLPLEHSEDLADQNTAVGLIAALGNAEFTRYAKAHRNVIARFGRFPHRNEVLGRISTPEEQAYLRKPGSGF